MSIFGRRESVLSGRGPNLVSDVARGLTDRPDTGRTQAMDLYPPASGTEEKWNRILVRDFACFIVTGDSIWDEHVALVCFKYNARVCAATSTTHSKHNL